MITRLYAGTILSMGCLTATRIAEIKAAIAVIDTQITAANTSLLSAIENAEVAEYRFDSGEGSQRTERRNPQQIEDLIDSLESRRARLQRKLDGTSNVNMNLRRRRGPNARIY